MDVAKEATPPPPESPSKRPATDPPENGTPVKRPRGRPRKIRPEEPPKPAGSVYDFPDDSNGPVASSTEIVVVPRKRGRPRKIRPEEPSIVAQSTPDIPGANIAQPVPSAEIAVIPRKRGRPRKIRPEEPPTVAAAQSASNPPGVNPDGQPIPSADIAVTPRKRGRPRKHPIEGAETPKTTRIAGDPSTPSGRIGSKTAATPQWRRNDRSARKKSARALIDRVMNGDNSDEDADEEIAREIYGSSDEEDGDGIDGIPGEPAPPVEAVTPTKRGRGRPRKTESLQTRKKSPTPPRDLPPHEMYFAQNRTGSSKTSHNTLASLSLLTHDEYFSILHEFKDRHAEDSEFLQSIHAESFPQWAFESAQGFSVCIYGYGSKRPLLHRFAKFLHDNTSNHETARIVIVNGYVRNTSVREILGTVASAVDPTFKLPAGNPAALLESVKQLLASHETEITIILNSIDALPLRRPNFQPVLAHLAAQRSVRLVCSADTPDFQLLWDSGLRSSFNFVFHDCTTFAPFTAEMDVVDDVHELLGRKARRVGGKEGVTYVLRSLPENAKNLFKLLVGEVLMAIDEEGLTGGENPGVEYRMVYSKAVEEFICSSEMAFRTLLKEFHDHQIITSQKDVLGAEMLSLPFRREELEAILEDLVT
ncbi:origin recognition complex subunit 2-domain-containing protein [Microdochium trichocladiopsis]|uniref:Origin recognition complex subunit 2 n=1 Tax=Microdochium trichocladiopsis TaxID=1682393 RepID=A0A9P8YAC2_9PEZI|nr:origin recognition complex subunit 2-domain-containing protein [Microdochium trichocladiopsis]KAH7033511.1 origin recognition complex subunit 2-domain-containing protein [Microdochium trichocladiopsis]